MPGFDLVVRGGTVATAADVFRADIGVREGRIAALGEDLPAGREEIDASGRLVLPGGVDAHCHLDQPTGDGSVMADDFLSGTRSAACGGTTTVMPFAAQMRGQSLRGGGRRLPPPGRGQGGRRLRLPPHRLRPDASRSWARSCRR